MGPTPREPDARCAGRREARPRGCRRKRGEGPGVLQALNEIIAVWLTGRGTGTPGWLHPLEVGERERAWPACLNSGPGPAGLGPHRACGRPGDCRAGSSSARFDPKPSPGPLKEAGQALLSLGLLPAAGPWNVPAVRNSRPLAHPPKGQITRFGRPGTLSRPIQPNQTPFREIARDASEVADPSGGSQGTFPTARGAYATA